MGNRLVSWGLAFVFVLGCVGCQKLTPAPVVVTTLPAIPLDYGDLVAVVPSTDPRWVALWFQRPDKSISIHRVNIVTGTLGTETDLPRK